MELKFKVHAKIAKPIAEVFDAVYNPQKLSCYFTTGGASGPLDEGKTVTWKFADVDVSGDVKVKQTVKNEKIVLECPNNEGGVTITEIAFATLDENSTLVSISEGGWREKNQESLDESYSHCMGWSQMLCFLKTYMEHDINLRKFFF